MRDNHYACFTEPFNYSSRTHFSELLFSEAFSQSNRFTEKVENSSCFPAFSPLTPIVRVSKKTYKIPKCNSEAKQNFRQPFDYSKRVICLILLRVFVLL